MKTTARTLLLAVGLPGLAALPVQAGDARAVTVDGFFREWRGVGVAAADPSGDGRAGGLDLRRLWLVNEADTLYLRLNVGRETLLQNPISGVLGNQLRLYVDTDASALTGKQVGSLGVEVEVRFGERRVVLYEATGEARALTPGQAGIRSLPTHSAAVFEIRVPLRTSEVPETIRLFLREEVPGGDRMPGRGTIRYEPSPETVEPPTPIRLDRRDPQHMRFLSLNVEDSLIARRKALYQRYLQAIGPDVLNFNSLTLWDAEQTRRYVTEVLDHPDNGTWWAAGVADCVTVSAYPILAQAAVDGNLLLYVDLPDERASHDLVLFNVHLPCCANEAGRDRESDNLARTWRDLLAGVGPFPIDADDVVIFAGDFNYVGLRRQVEAVRDGLFIDPSLGPDFAPGRLEGSLVSAPLRHSHVRSITTWRFNSSPFAPGKLDYVFYSSDAARLEKSYVLDTATLPAEELRRFRLRRRDSLLVSDHLVLVTDFSFR